MKITKKTITTYSVKTILVLFILQAFTFSIGMAQNNCIENKIPKLADVEIISVTQEKSTVSFCKVVGVIGKTINFELLLPNNWNGKFVMSGGGGFAGSVINVTLAYGVLEKGYATIGTDTGHEGHILDGSWALNDLEAIVNFGHLAIHRTAVTAKAMIKGYYGKDIDQSYFIGCSRGGGQAMMEAQRYPKDFDGIVAGAPAYNWTGGIAAHMVNNVKQMYPDPFKLDKPLINKKDLELIKKTYLSMCDKLDGIEDGFLNDPRDCPFDPSVLLCKGEKTEDCLTAQQVSALKSMYNGPKDINGNQLYYGIPLGGETDAGGWETWLTGGLVDAENAKDIQHGIKSKQSRPKVPNAHYALGVGLMRYFIFNDSSWTYENYNFENFRSDAKAIGNVLNATSPDLSEFRKNGGKLLMYNGWSDMAVTALGTIGYYENVIENDPTAVNDVKLYLLPGVLHCAMGDGPWAVNWLDEIDKWITQENEPHQLTVHFIDEKGQPDGSRILCPYPEVAIYDDKGDTRDAKSFKCGLQK